MRKKKLISSIITSILVLTLVGCSGDKPAETQQKEKPNTNTNTNTKQEEKVEAKQGKEFYFDGTVAEIRDVKIEILDHKVILPGEEGNDYGEKPLLAFWYNTTSKTGKEIDPITAWLAIFKAIQDNNPNMINELNFGALPDHRFLDTQTNIIKEGGTVENAVSYELSDLETPVTLVANQGLMGDEIGRYDYDVK